MWNVLWKGDGSRTFSQAEIMLSQTSNSQFTIWRKLPLQSLPEKIAAYDWNKQENHEIIEPGIVKPVKWNLSQDSTVIQTLCKVPQVP